MQTTKQVYDLLSSNTCSGSQPLTWCSVEVCKPRWFRQYLDNIWGDRGNVDPKAVKLNWWYEIRNRRTMPSHPKYNSIVQKSEYISYYQNYTWEIASTCNLLLYHKRIKDGNSQVERIIPGPSHTHMKSCFIVLLIQLVFQSICQTLHLGTHLCKRTLISSNVYRSLQGQI